MTAIQGIVSAITLVASVLFLIFTFLARLFRGFEAERKHRDNAEERSRRRQR